MGRSTRSLRSAARSNGRRPHERRKQAVSVAEGAGSAVITDNIFQDMGKGAVLGFEWEKQVSDELAGDNSRYGQLTIERNRIS